MIFFNECIKNTSSIEELSNSYFKEFFILEKTISDFNSMQYLQEGFIDSIKSIGKSIYDKIVSILHSIKNFFSKLYDRIVGKNKVDTLVDTLQAEMNKMLNGIDFSELQKSADINESAFKSFRESSEDECVIRNGKILFRAILYKTANLFKFPNPIPIINCIKHCRTDSAFTINESKYYEIISEVIGEHISSNDEIESACRSAFSVHPDEKPTQIEINRGFMDDAKKFLNPSTGFEGAIEKMTIIMKSFNVEFSNLCAKLNDNSKIQSDNNGPIKYLVMMQRAFLRIFSYWSACMRKQSSTFLRGIYLVKDLIRRIKAKTKNESANLYTAESELF